MKLKSKPLLAMFFHQNNSLLVIYFFPKSSNALMCPNPFTERDS